MITGMLPVQKWVDSNWDMILSFSIESIQAILMTKVPLIWTILTSLAVKQHRSQLVETRAQSKQGGQGSNNMRDPYLVSETTPFMLPSLQAPSSAVLL